MEVSSMCWDAGAGWTSLPPLDSASTLVVVFGDRALDGDSRFLDTLAEAYPTSVVVGCSSAGQFVGTGLVDDTAVAAVARFDRVRLAKAAASITHAADSHRTGGELGERLTADDLRAVFLLSDGLHVNGSALVAGLAEAVGPSVVVTGGLAGDGDRFESTWVLDDGERRTQRVVAVGLYGSALDVSSGTAGGWRGFGPARRVTRSSDNVLYELDGQPALELYQRYLGDLATDLPASALLFPLSVRPPDGAEPVVRTVLAVDEAEQSMTFAGDIPTGWEAQLMRSSPDRLVDGAGDAGARSTVERRGGPALTIAVSCVGRRLVLGQRADDEIEATRDALPDGDDLVGFYSYGEIAPGADGVAGLHNQTMTITSLAEAVVG